MAAMGSTKSPTFVLFSPPHLPRNSTPFGSTADSRSMTVAAIALPIPKFRMVMFSAVAEVMGRSRPRISTPNFAANIST